MYVPTGTAASPGKEGNRPQPADILQFGHRVPQTRGWSAAAGRHEGERAQTWVGPVVLRGTWGGGGGLRKKAGWGEEVGPSQTSQDRINCVCGRGQGEWDCSTFERGMIIGLIWEEVNLGSCCRKGCGEQGCYGLQGGGSGVRLRSGHRSWPQHWRHRGWTGAGMY